jgi:hypothetical protein
VIAAVATVVYAVIAARHANLLKPSHFAYFNYLAHAFLDGHLHLVELPPSTHDLSSFGGKYYLYWPPFPAVALMPFVAVWGARFSDVLFTIALGGLGVAVVGLLLREASSAGLITVSVERRNLLVATLALGCPYLTLAAYGRVWYTAQLVGFLCVAVAFLAAVRLQGWTAFVVAGTAIACAALTRNHLIFTGLWPAAILLHRRLQPVEERRSAPGSHRRLLLQAAAGVAPLLVAIALLAIYNAARFGSPFETGIPFHRMDPGFRAEYERYGAFSLHFLPTNFHYQFLAYPFPLRPESLMGGSLFLLTPVFLAAFWGLWTARPRWSAGILVTSIVLTAIPILLLMGTGWTQFGPRYTVDFTVPLLLLTAAGLERWPVWLIGSLTVISILHYLAGAFYLGTLIV